jgi:undecaprenyl-diphosphatase
MTGVLAHLDASDRRICWRLASWHQPRWFHGWMVCSTRLGDGWLWIAAGVALSWGLPASGRLLAALALSAAAANGIQVLLKGRVRRARPALRPHDRFIAGVAERFAFGEFSFPSGHAMNAFALATTLSVGVPAAAPLLAVLAVSIAASRVVLGFHFVLDVGAGAVLGVVVGAACALAIL